jgi:hypothetical protein
MPNITVTLTDTQAKGLEFIAVSTQDWVENLTVDRARIAVDEIVQIVTNYCLDNGVQVPATREAIVAYGFDNDIVKTAAVRTAEVEAQTLAE